MHLLSAVSKTIPHFQSKASDRIAGKAVRLVLLAGLAVLLLPAILVAQNIQYTQNKPDMTLRSDLRVDPSTLGMSLQIPLANYPGRAGTSVPLVLYYNSKVWRIEFDDWVNGNMSNCSNPPEDEVGLECYTTTRALFAEKSVAGWTFSSPFPTIEYGDERYNSSGRACCAGDPNQGYYIARMTVRFPDGSTHELRRGDTELPGADTLTGTYLAVDSSRLKFNGTSPGWGTLYLPDGSHYDFGNYSATQYVDRNGNVLEGQLDTLGRQLITPSFHNGSVHTETHAISGVNDVPLNYSFELQQLGSLLEPDMLTGQVPALHRDGDMDKFGNNVYGTTLFSSGSGSRVISSGVFNPVVLHRITLPNGTAYTFTYNEYGEIAKVVYPTGGYERFRYGFILPLAPISEPYAQANRGVMERRVSTNAPGSVEAIWYYNPPGTLVSMIAPDGTSTVRSVHTGYTSGTVVFGFDDPRAGMVYEERVHAPGGAELGPMLRRTLTKWDYTGPTGNGQATAKRDPRVTRTIEILLDTGGSALAKTTVYQHDADLNVIGTQEYDFVPLDQTTAQSAAIDSISAGTLLRSSAATFLVNDPAIDANIRTAYRDRNLVGLPSSTTVYKGPPGDANAVAQSKISYDEGGQFAQLNDYGSVPSWTDPQNPYRGNPTTASQWLNFNGSTLSTFPNGTYLTTHAQYDQCGSVRKTWDAKGNQSQIDYSLDYKYAYPTTTTTAVPDPDGAYGSNVAFTTASVYDFRTGRVTSTTDANGQTTSYDYTDSLNRLKQVTMPDTGRVRYNYFDTPDDLYVQVLTDEDASRSIETRQYFDGLGRPIRGFLYEGTAATPWLVTDTYYDTMGRVAGVSNPYRVGSPSSSVPTSCSACTTSAYDQLGRVKSVTTPDSAQVITSYPALTSGSFLGTMVLATDQAGRKRRSLTDALGRLVRVDEPDKVTGDLGEVSNPAQPTSYAYDVLGNLRQVTQDSQQRFFVYDSLSRLLRARNPELAVNANLPALSDPLTGNNQWSLSYAYDANGNLTEKTDARGVVSTYAYDALNRNTTVNYSNDPAGTPAVSRFYDGYRGTNQNLSNSNGRLWQTETSGTAGSRTTAGNFDVIGRPGTQDQRFYRNNAWSESYTVGRTYDLAGHVLTQTYPSGHTVTYAYDAAGRTSSFSGKLGDNVLRNYSTEIVYSALGAITKEKFGTDTPIFNKLFYNSRGQLAEIRESTSYTGPTDTDGNRGALLNQYSDQCNGSSCNGTDNNGNLKKQEIFVPGSSSWLQEYDYDNLNRLQAARETVNGGLVQWQQTYVYDRYGNRTIAQGVLETYGAGINKKDFTVNVANKNRLGVPSGQIGAMDYDAAGNLTNDTYTGVGSYQYDAENRLTHATPVPVCYPDGEGEWTCNAGGVGPSEYVYDGDGQRVRRIVPSVSGPEETWQVYGMGGELLAEYAPNAVPSTIKKEYGYRNGVLLVTGQKNAGNANLEWLVTDQLGTPRMVIDKTGSLTGVSRHDYLPFGEELFAGTGGRTTTQGYSAADSVRQKFTSYERDNETGLDFAKARYFSSVQGRFASVDPVMGSAQPGLPQSWNRYTYTINNPLKYVDPSGLVWGMKKTGDNTEYMWFEGDTVGKGYDTVTNFYVEGRINGNQVGLTLNPNGPRSFWTQLALDLDPGLAVTTNNSDYFVKGYQVGETKAQFAEYSRTGAVDKMQNQAFDVGLTLAGIRGMGVLNRGAAGAAVEGITTPYGSAFQAMSAESLAAREAVENGGTLYRGGVLGKSAGPEGQFWSLENPLNSGYARRYGIPSGNSNFNFIEYGKLKPGSAFITRPAPGGAGIETVVNPNSVRATGFHMP